MEKLNEKIVKILKEKNKTISFMESCTGGFFANEITNVTGASNVLKVSLVTYSNEFKEKFGVSKNIIDKYTVYSKETAIEMAKNVVKFSNADYGIGITGELGNSLKENNKVFYCIYDSLNNIISENQILVEPNKREIMKAYVANIVLEDLWNILMKN